MKLCERCGACFDDNADACSYDRGALTSAFKGSRTVGGRYLLEQRISSGAMGVVMRAAHLQVGSTVAVKLMRPQKDRHRVALQRFRREAQILGQIKHPNAVLVIDFGVDVKDGAELPYLVMEFLRGESLDDVMAKKRTFTLDELERLLTPLCEAVEEAHQVGVIHRDIKPSNVFLERLRDGAEIVKVLDFGIAKFVELERAEGRAAPPPISFPDGAPATAEGDPFDDNEFLDEILEIRSDSIRLRATTNEAPTLRDRRAPTPRPRSPTTEAGFMIGTVPYMAPEQMTGDTVSRRTDVHAVAVLAFQLLAGRLPFEGDDDDIIQAKLAGERVSLRELGVDVPRELDDVLAQAFAVDPGRRPASVRDIANAVRAAAGPSTASGRAVGRDPATTYATAVSRAADMLDELDAALGAWIDAPDEDAYGRARDLLLSADAPIRAARALLDHVAAPLPTAAADVVDGAQTQLETVLFDLQRRLALLAERGGPAEEYAAYLAALWGRLQGAAQAISDGGRRLLGGDDDPANDDDAAASMLRDLQGGDEEALAPLLDRAGARDPLDAMDAFDELLDHHLDAIVGVLARGDDDARALAGRIATTSWRHADKLVLREMYPGAAGRRQLRLLPLLASKRDLPGARPFVDLARLLAAKDGTGRALDEVREAAATPHLAEPRGVLLRCLLVHPAEAVRAWVASQIELSGFWNVVAHAGVPLTTKRYVFEKVCARGASSEYLKVFFFCVLDHLRASSQRPDLDEAFALLRRFFTISSFHEDAVFEPLLEVERLLRNRASAVGRAPNEDSSYTEALAAFTAQGATDNQPLEQMLDVPLPIQRKLAREGLYLSHFVCHANERVALETVPHLLRQDDVTRYLRIPTIHRAVLVELSKRRRFFRKDAPRLALLTNPKTPALVARAFLPFVADDQLRLLAVNKHINPDVRRLIKGALGKTRAE